MTSLALSLILMSMVCVPLYWLLPEKLRDVGVIGFSLMVVLLVSPWSGLWLGLSTVLIPQSMKTAERFQSKGICTLIWIVFLVLMLGLSRDIALFTNRFILWLGGAYFTLRHIHVLLEWWYGRVQAPTLLSYARYQLFLPVIMSGPIHRFSNFEREVSRRRWDGNDFWAGAERTLLGLGFALVIGSFVFTKIDGWMLSHFRASDGFFSEWAYSIVAWPRLYVEFSSTTSIALGISLMMGLRLEENFDAPWKAKHLVDFWGRWHKTLSSWCRDYVFGPVTAYFRSPLVGVTLAMLVLGLWHEQSAYYVLWAFWQTIGIVLTRLYMNSDDPLRFGKLPDLFKTVGGPLLVIGWLSLAQPVLHRIIGIFTS